MRSPFLTNLLASALAPHNTKQEGHNTTPFRSVISQRITRLEEIVKINYNNTEQYPKVKET